MIDLVQHAENSKGTMVTLNEMYMGRMLCIPREGEIIRISGTPRKISTVIWQFNGMAGEWEVSLKT